LLKSVIVSGGTRYSELRLVQRLLSQQSQVRVLSAAKNTQQTRLPFNLRPATAGRLKMQDAKITDHQNHATRKSKKCMQKTDQVTGRENDGPSRSQGVKMQDIRMQDIKLQDTKMQDLKCWTRKQNGMKLLFTCSEVTGCYC